MSFKTHHLHHQWSLIPVTLLLSLLFIPSLSLNPDGTLLLSFKYSVLSDPLSVLSTWNYNDETPCSWLGIMCLPLPNPSDTPRVVALVLPNSQILGSVPEDLGLIEHLRHLDLSNNLLNGSLPNSLFNASELKIFSLSNNVISGQLPESFQGLQNLQQLNLSDNALTGKIPQTLSSLQNLTVLNLKNNYFYGEIPNGFDSIQVLDLSSNLINGSLPPDIGGKSVQLLNLSYNKLSGEIPVDFASNVPAKATIDLSFNNLSGQVPESQANRSQKTELLSGNPDLCGKPINTPCLIPSSGSIPPNDSPSSFSNTSVTTNTTTTSPPAIAAIPKTIDSSPASGSGSANANDSSSGLRTGTIVGIIVGDLAGIGVLCTVFFYLYKLNKKKKEQGKKTTSATNTNMNTITITTKTLDKEEKGGSGWLCLRTKGIKDEETSETSMETSSEEEEEEDGYTENKKEDKGGTLVTVDGDGELELESLLKASAYILGASGSSIVYKAVLEDGTTFAVRRIGESGVERFRDFENQVRLIAKLRHPNILRIRGFYWGLDEKLIIYDHISNGSLANIGYKRPGSSPYHIQWEARLKIARGVARGLTYIHEKKHVHGNLKPSNILLGPNMDPQIGDFGLEKLVWGDNSYKAYGSARNFGSNRSTASRDSFQDLPMGMNPSPSPSSSSLIGGSPYHAPESLKTLKPNPKWDVYSFGIILLELLTGKAFTDQDLGYWSTGFMAEESSRVLRMTDVAIRADVEGKEDALMTCFKLGFSCASMVPQKRPSMKEVVQILEKIPSSSSHQYDH